MEHTSRRRHDRQRVTKAATKGGARGFAASPAVSQ